MSQFLYSKKGKLETRFLDVVIGAAGAVTSFVGDEIADVVRTGAGAYQITLSKKMHTFLNLKGILVAAAAEDLGFQVAGFDMAAKTIDIITHAAGVATDPSNGAILKLELLFNNTSV